MKNTRRIIFSILLVVIYLVSAADLSLVIQKGQKPISSGDVSQEQLLETTKQQGTRNENYYQMTVHGQFMYFSYSKYSCVDVYDFESNFQHTIIVPDFPTGTVCVCSEDNQLYIFSKSGTLFVIDANGTVHSMSRQQAAERGYTTNWCREKNQEQSIYIDKEYIIINDADGNEARRMKTPSQIADNLPFLQLSPKLEAWVVVCGFAVLFFGTIILVAKKLYSSSGQEGVLRESNNKLR